MAKACLAVRHVAFEDLGLLGPLVAARGYDVRYHDAGIDRFDGETLIAPDLVVVLGGPIGVYEAETYPFITDEIAAIAARLAANKPILGICLGAQMMAAALGARVEPGPVKEIGWAPLTLTAVGQVSVLAPLGTSPVLHWHGDNCDLPGAVSGSPRRRIARCRRFSASLHSLRCNFIWRPSRRGSNPGWSAIPSSSARPASIRVRSAGRCTCWGRTRASLAAKCWQLGSIRW